MRHRAIITDVTGEEQERREDNIKKELEEKRP
jgi:hypothetical protein